MLNYDLVFGALVAIGLVVIIRFVFPLYLDRTTIYKNVKSALLLFGHAFNDQKIKAITDSIFKIVSILETWDLSNEQKKFAATEVAYRELVEEFGINLPEEAIDLLISIAVAQLPPTHKEPKKKDPVAPEKQGSTDMVQ